jgi:hypothetical protein
MQRKSRCIDGASLAGSLIILHGGYSSIDRGNELHKGTASRLPNRCGKICFLLESGHHMVHALAGCMADNEDRSMSTSASYS